MRPIRLTTAVGVGATYIPVNRYCDDTSIVVVANGTVTFTVDSTLDNIRPTAGLVNSPSDAVAAASAVWINEIASGSVDANAHITKPIDSLRVNITAGAAGSVSITVVQDSISDGRH